MSTNSNSPTPFLSTPEEMRAWLRQVTTGGFEDKTALDYAETYCYYLLMDFSMAPVRVDEFVETTDNWIRELLQHIEGSTRVEIVFVIIAACFSDEWVRARLGGVFAALGMVHRGSPTARYDFVLFDFLAERYRIVTGEPRAIQSMTTVLENLRL